MDWATRRRTILFIGVGLVLLTLLAGVAIAIFYEAPSCTDRKQNQGEGGVDCGGPCSYLCEASVEAPNVRFARTIIPQAGRADVIASIENKNRASAARAVGYTVELYDADNAYIGKQTGIIDLPPASTVPVFIPAASVGVRPATRAFLTIDESTLHWFAYEDTRPLPTVSDIRTENDASPRISAVLTNDSFDPLYGVAVIATVFDADGNAIAASKTVLPSIGARDTTTAIFTWNLPFPGNPVRIEVVPVLPLPTAGI